MAPIVDWLLLSVLSALIWGAAMVVNKLVVGSYLQPLSFSFIAVVFDTGYIIEGFDYPYVCAANRPSRGFWWGLEWPKAC